MTYYILAWILSIIAVGLITPLVITLYRSQGWVDDPKKSKHPKVVHLTSVPRGGGIAIYLGMFFVSLFVLPWNPVIVSIFSGATILAILGFLDDLHDLNPYFRLTVLIVPALIVVLSGITMRFVSNPFGEGVLHLIPWVANVFAVVWIIWNMNIVNWSKGLDGQMPGFVSIAAGIIALLSLRFSADPSQHSVTLLACIVSGGFLGFLFWNMYPQKIMPGFGAGTLAGFFLAILSMMSGAKVATALLVLAIPMIDATFVILRRLIHRKSPVWGDRGHLHHRLLDLGWSKRQVALFYWITTALLGMISLQLNSQQKFYTILAVILLFGGFVAWITLFFSSSNRLVRDSG
ncbi:MAG: UDP-N-acetylmuramyl pentapeptide phosphotransferase/UDP-N-acetylglucosamine-1-phosphate transferase [Microgenomates group bacterium GW2011_GWF2_45_18]|nr:MAG: UDP-N-acetylmuramyl pentapeptide phosphotransferase/UDP-N-acetylglucosamine-1-phosphate transferase [Microgenomates group bacterium GW2011_GWF1_44_10]KKU02036.1 MAG: UDP-N-acetylmuramyl pentapeptide phosphotransferase/UDP-N-acetylglucosamine-1-phosphate transferase [Microgenomates group bacterium GW2011_GWF2_45_18]OGJ40624.1 MAG: hypothetical protein A2378_01165 [Candidatus Pacebacteria bacterium RIFOXYB1_FULL_44_10]HAU99308.1 hypothetical protein [Candidatus Paceibacterota bacterium]HA